VAACSGHLDVLLALVVVVALPVRCHCHCLAIIRGCFKFERDGERDN